MCVRVAAVRLCGASEDMEAGGGAGGACLRVHYADCWSRPLRREHRVTRRPWSNEKVERWQAAVAVRNEDRGRAVNRPRGKKKGSKRALLG